MEITNTLTSTGTSAWAGFGMDMALSPKQAHQGIGLPFAGYAAAVLPTRVRTADAKVPDPRGRQR